MHGSQLSLTNHAPTTSTTYKPALLLARPHPVVACVDTGCTDTLFRASDADVLHTVNHSGGLQVLLPNGAIIESTATGKLGTSPNDVPVHIFPDNLLGKSLHAVADWTNNGCTVVFTATGVTVTRDATNQVVHQTTKEPSARLWDLILHRSAVCGNVVRHESNAQFVEYVYTTMGSPPSSTFKECVGKGWLRSYPRLTTDMVNKNTPHTPASSKGHLDRNRAGQRSTKTPVPASPSPPHNDVADAEDDEFFVTNIFTKVYDINDEDMAVNYSDLPGKFPFQSMKGMNYLLLSSFRGYIHVEPMPDRSSPSLVAAYRATYEFFKYSRQKPKFQRLDNETSADLESFFKNEAKVVFQYLPPDNHRANKAERHIRYYKNHFISMLATVHPDCPMSLWDQFVPQSEITANHFIPWLPDPRLSAYEGFHGGTFDFSRYPLAPVGTRVEIYESAAARESWAPHSVSGFYLGPSLQHYRSYRTFAVNSQGFRVSDSLDWFPLTVKMPGSSIRELLLASLLDMTSAIRKAMVHPEHTTSGHPFPFDDTMTTAIKDASNLFNELARPTQDPLTHSAILQRVPSSTTLASPQDPPSLQRVSAPTAVSPQDPPSLQRVSAPPAVSPQLDGSSSHPTSSRSKERALARKANKTAAIRYRPVDVAALTHHQRRYADYIDRLFLDKTSGETFKIVDIEYDISSNNKKSNTKSSRRGSRTPLFKFYDTIKFSSPPLDDLDYEHTRCTEILQQGKHSYVQWLTLSTDDTWSTSLKAQSSATHISSGQANSAECTTAPVLNLDSAGKPLSHSSALKGPNGAEWRRMDGQEISRLIDSETLRAIHRSECPTERRSDITYYKPVVKEKWNSDALMVDRRVRGTIGGDRINYPGEVSSATADIFTVKALFHSVVSDRHTKGTDTRFCTLDIKDFYLGTPLKRKEYVSIPLKYIPADIIAKYALEQFISNDSILFEVSKCMYGLPQAGLLSHNHLVDHLALHGYIQDDDVPCLFTHISHDVQFTLVVDDFGIKYSNVDDVHELVRILQLHWPIKLDLSGTKYLGYRLAWDYVNNTLTLDMPDYIPKVLARFTAGKTLRGAATPALYIPPSKNQKSPQPTPCDTSERVAAADKQFIMEVNGSMLYYARAIDHLMIPACTDISCEQANATQRTLPACWRLLNYASTHQGKTLVFRGCDMILKIKSDASYLSRPNSGSVAGGFHYCGNRDDDTICGVLFAMSSSIPTVCAAVSEAEYAALFMNAQHGAWERTVLGALRYPQTDPTRMETDNKTAAGISNRTCRVKRSKAIAMRYHWVRDRVKCGEFAVYWAPGRNNLADFFTKPQPDWRHKEFESRLATPQ